MYPRFASVLLLSVCAFGLGIAAPAFPEEKCGPNAEFQTCGSACVPDCANPIPREFCSAQCVIGCFCKEGFLKNAKGECVRPQECEPHVAHHEIPMQFPAIPKCPDNEEFNECGSACAPTCANPHPSARCTKNCVVACFCKEGYLRNAAGVCVPTRSCDAPMLFAYPPELMQCKENEVFLPCGSACSPTCASPHPTICTLQCILGCFCKPGYLKNEHGECVPSESCGVPAAQAMPMPPQVCSENEEYRQCKGCDGTCKNPNPICPRICLPGCACKQGLLRNANGRCVPTKACEADLMMAMEQPTPKCGENEIFLTCGTACPATCAKPNPTVCTMNCVIGCFCQEGFLKNANGACVPAANCEPHVEHYQSLVMAMSSPPQVCGENEEYRQCKGCDGTCKNPIVVCPAICLPGCACKHDHLRDDNGRCVPSKSCGVAFLTEAAMPKCGANEIFQTCGTACPATCANPHPSPVCTKNCVIGCFCQQGFLKNANGACVPAANCEPHVEHYQSLVMATQVCSENEEYRGCKGCDGTCKNPIVPCSKICRPGCACKHDYLRDDNGRCVPSKSCGVAFLTDAAMPKCGANEIFRTCGTACPATCANPHPSAVCTRNCVIGCFCQDGFLKNAKGVCVPAANCEPHVEHY